MDDFRTISLNKTESGFLKAVLNDQIQVVMKQIDFCNSEDRLNYEYQLLFLENIKMKVEEVVF